MKMIVERLDGETYVYRETEEQYKVNEKGRQTTSTRVSLDQFDNECLFDNYPDNCYAVIPMRVSPRKEKESA